ncbi:MAG: extracellular solute-binding protein [Oscillospiraceae bacterium]|nr:extracellular solute-binding protein [Oscillospiraceae bacterium]
MKKFLAIVLALTVVLGLCAACANKDAEVGDKFDADGKVTIQVGLGSSAKVISFTDNALTKWLEEQTGCNLEIVEYSGGTDIATQISTTIAARQNLPDVLWGVSLNSETLATYGKEGYIVDLKDYYADKEGASKTFWTRMEECLTEDQREYVLSKLVNPDTGGMYGVPTIETSLVDGVDYMVWINTKWLEKVGKEKPTNIEELYDVLKAFSTVDFDGNGKLNEIPLFGSQAASAPAQVVNWIANMYMYYNDAHLWQDYDGDGKIEHAKMQETYREALKFVNKLYKEGLLTKMVYTANNAEMKQITTPSNGKAMCGIFLGHLTSNTTFGNEVMFEYENLKPWGCATERDLGFSISCFITETAEKRDVVDECFKLLMTMWTWDGSMRIRYGAYGENWVEPDEGALSDYGLPATYKLLDDPFTQQNAVQWGSASGSLNHYAEGETAQAAENLDLWTATKSKMHAEARKNFDWAVENINPKYMADPFVQTFIMTSEEDDSISIARTNMNSYISSAAKDFITGSNNMDINDDADWKAYLAKLDELGYKDVQAMYQKCFERQTAEG